MANTRLAMNALMRGLVKRHYPDKQNVAAREIQSFIEGREVRLEDTDIGGFSRKMNGTREWTMMDVVAIQALTNSTRITDAIDEDHVPSTDEKLTSLLQLASHLVKESGEGVAAVMDIENGGCREEARVQLLDIRDALNRVLSALDAEPAQPTQFQRRAS